MSNTSLSEYSTVFCDSTEALGWAYDQGLSTDAIIKTSSPALLLSDNPNVEHVESRWTISTLKVFQSSIEPLSRSVYDAVLGVSTASREDAIAVALAVVHFQRVLFKAACMTESDVTEQRLFISVDGYGGAGGNNMNAPWGWLLEQNSLFSECAYKLSTQKWEGLSTHGISLFKRIKLAGFNVIFIRLMLKIWQKMPSWSRQKNLLIPRENELVLDIASYLSRRAVSISAIKTDASIREEKRDVSSILAAVHPVIKAHIESWVVRDLVAVCEKNVMNKIAGQLSDLDDWELRWNKTLAPFKAKPSVILTNAPGNVMGLGLLKVAESYDIPVTSVQHGVSKEICSTLVENVIGDEINASNLYFTYNDTDLRH